MWGGSVSKNWDCQFIFVIYWFCFFGFEEDVWSGTNNRTIASAYCVFEELNKIE